MHSYSMTLRGKLFVIAKKQLRFKNISQQSALFKILDFFLPDHSVSIGHGICPHVCVFSASPGQRLRRLVRHSRAFLLVPPPQVLEQSKRYER